MNYAYGDTVTLNARVLSDTHDAYGNDVYTTETSTVLGGFAPAGSVEQVQGQQLVTTQPTAYLPAGVDVAAIDSLTIRGVTYEVDGPAEVWVQPFTGWTAGVVVRLRGVTG